MCGTVVIIIDWSTLAVVDMFGLVLPIDIDVNVYSFTATINTLHACNVIAHTE